MKVLDLRCAQDHAFEGWFASEDDYQTRLSKGLLVCPMCGDKAIFRLPSASRLNLSGGSPSPHPQQTSAADRITRTDVMLQAAWLRAMRRVVEQTEDVGERFVEEARRMHYGEVDERPIRGQATLSQTQELLEEGIPVLPLLLPNDTEGPLQ